MVHISNEKTSAPRSQTPTEIALANVGDYHGEKAAAAYLSGDIDLYCRHVAIADRLWAQAS